MTPKADPPKDRNGWSRHYGEGFGLSRLAVASDHATAPENRPRPQSGISKVILVKKYFMCQ